MRLFLLFCKFMKEFTINLTDLYSPNNSAPYNQVFQRYFQFENMQ